MRTTLVVEIPCICESKRPHLHRRTVTPVPEPYQAGCDPQPVVGCFAPYADHGKVFGPQVGIGVYDLAWQGW